MPKTDVQVKPPLGWTNSTPAQRENEPDSWSLDMPGIDEIQSIEDPHGDDESMIQRIAVCGFGKVENNIAFLSVDDSTRSVQEGNIVLGFHVVKIDNPFVTFAKAGRRWELSTARKPIQQDNQYRNLVPLAPPIFDDHTSPKHMALESTDPAHEIMDLIDFMLEDLDQNIPDPMYGGGLEASAWDHLNHRAVASNTSNNTLRHLTLIPGNNPSFGSLSGTDMHHVMGLSFVPNEGRGNDSGGWRVIQWIEVR